MLHVFSSVCLSDCVELDDVFPFPLHRVKEPRLSSNGFELFSVGFVEVDFNVSKGNGSFRHFSDVERRAEVESGLPDFWHFGQSLLRSVDVLQQVQYELTFEVDGISAVDNIIECSHLVL